DISDVACGSSHMSAAEEQKQALSSALEAASGALAGLDEEQRAASDGGVGLLERTLSYARLVVEGADPELIPGQYIARLTAALAPIAPDPVGASAGAQTHADAILNALVGFPGTRGHAVEQSAHTALADFEKSASKRLAELHDQTSKVQAQLTELGST